MRSRLVQRALDYFERTFGSSAGPPQVAIAPGRVNLIGELPASHQPERVRPAGGIGGLLEIEMELEREEREPDSRGVTIDRVDRWREFFDHGAPFRGLVSTEMLVEVVKRSHS